MGAIGLLVHRLARDAGGEVVGRPVEHPFTDATFHPSTPGWGFTATSRYTAGVAATLRGIGPALVEVHNRPEIALSLARRFPRVALFLHNDPQGMRGARTAAQRATLLQKVDRVITVSAHLRRQFLEGVEGDVTVMPNCIDVPERSRKVRERLILFVGRVVADKGADAFVEACAASLPQLPGWQAEMVGADRFAPDSPGTDFTAHIADRAQQAGVATTGYLSHAAAMERMGRAAIVVVPSRWPEPFGMTALEAMAHGAALICSRRGGLPEVAGNCAVYADPDAPGAIKDAILALANDPNRRTALAAAARKRAQTYDTPVAVARLLALRSELLAC
ncbi:glycosyltransferase family 4 protein [Acidisphaera sp. L21]|uniref:glycosyltransferase family 4 protein n=1 Tax=Acidisphaera sp. L21 TaxID=1641851 RepID=UPI00131BCB55|nr:glycosyltransferase family 4 protein [Acidisphaera sp. L21]